MLQANNKLVIRNLDELENINDNIKILILNDSFNEDYEINDLSRFKLDKLELYNYKKQIDFFPEDLKIYHNNLNINITNILNLPKTLKELRFKTLEPLKNEMFSNKLIKLNITYNKINKDFLFPKSLKSLTLISSNINLDFSYLTNLTELYLNYDVNHNDNSIEDVEYDYDIKKLPMSLKKLYINSTFNNDIEILPPKLNSLLLIHKFNKKFKKNVLHNNLRELILGDYYNQPFEKDVLPNKLTKLKLGSSYNQKFEKNVLPSGLKILDLNGVYNQKFEINTLPLNLKKLYISGIYNQPFNKNVLPDSLITLNIDSPFNHKFTSLPNNLRDLLLKGAYNQPFDNMFNNTKIKNLTLKYRYNQPFTHSFPETLENLYIQGDFNQPLYINSYKYLLFKKRIPILPKSLKRLELSINEYSYNFQKTDFISNKLYIMFGAHYYSEKKYKIILELKNLFSNNIKKWNIHYIIIEL